MSGEPKRVKTYDPAYDPRRDILELGPSGPEIRRAIELFEEGYWDAFADYVEAGRPLDHNLRKIIAQVFRWKGQIPKGVRPNGPPVSQAERDLMLAMEVGEMERKHPDGRRLPAIHARKEVAKRHGVSVDTVRRAAKKFAQAYETMKNI